MGRSISSTKSGKFMNPTDQARKEARRRELKKNKKQRTMVRAAVLKMKDPKQILRDMEKLDKIEFDPVQPPQLNEKVLKDKGKKLRETFQRILRLYAKENPGMYKELQELEVEYEQKRAQLSQYFDAVKKAQAVDVESIPLPDMPYAPSNILSQDIPLPGAQPPSILKKTSAHGPPTRAVSILPLPGHVVPHLPPGRKPPGPPPGPPPPQVLRMYRRKVSFAPRGQEEIILYSPGLAHRGHDDETSSTSKDEGMDQEKYGSDTDRSDADSEGEEFMHCDDEKRENTEGKKSGPSVRFPDVPGKSRKQNMKELTPLQVMMLRIAGQEILEEGQRVEKEEEEEEEDSEDSESEDTVQQQQHKEESLPHGASSSPASQKQQPPLLSVVPAQIQAPPMPGQLPLRPPLAPPLRPPGMPGLQEPLPQLLPPVPPPRAPPQRLPPPAPPGIPLPPPGMMHPPLEPPLRPAPAELFPPAPLLNPRVLSAPPNLVQRPKMDDTSTTTIEKKATAVISAKPQIIALKAEITRFVPTALRVQRENKRATAAPQRKSEGNSALPLAQAVPKSGPPSCSVQTKDDAYEAFMKEMEGLL